MSEKKVYKDLSKTNSPLEQARKAFALHRFKLAVAQSDYLGERAIRPNHFYFGNNPGEKKMGKNKRDFVEVGYFWDQFWNAVDPHKAEVLRKTFNTLVSASKFGGM